MLARDLHRCSWSELNISHAQIAEEGFAGGWLVSARNGDKLLEAVYRAAAKVANVRLTPRDIELKESTQDDDPQAIAETKMEQGMGQRVWG